MCKFKTTVLKTILLLICLIFLTKVTYASPPQSVQLMQELKQTPPTKHGPIYKRIAANTEVLSHRGLQQELLRVIRETWYEELIRKPVLETEGNVQLGKEFSSRETIDPLLEVIKGMPTGKTKTKMVMWIHVNPGVGIRVSPYLRKYIKKRGKESLKIWLQRVNFDSEFSDYRKLNTPLITRSIYEATRVEQDSINSGLTIRLKKYCKMVLKKKEKMGGKTFCYAYFLDNQMSEKKLNNLLKFPNVGIGADYYKKKIKSRAKKWRSEYPKWPLNNDSKGDMPPGHKKKKGQGHKKGKEKGHH